MDTSDESLIAKYVAGDEHAFEELTRRHLKTVYSFVLRLVGSEHEAEDITQETFVKAWRGLSRYQKETASFKTWLLRIARNSAIDFLRKKKHIPFSVFENDEGQNVLAETTPDETPLADELFARGEQVAELEEAIATLPPQAREILVLHYSSGLTFLEIGALLNEPANTVKSRHHRALGQLRKLLSKSTKVV